MTAMMLLAAIAGPLWAAEAIAVHLTDNAVVPLIIKGPAKAQASRMFAKLGIGLVWSNARPSETGTHRPILIELAANTPARLLPNALATTSLEDDRIVVFYDRIAAGSGRAAPGNGEVLAHVLVHEIAHVLQGVARHSDEGIMKAQWSLADYSQMHFQPLAFTPLDVELIQKGAAARMQPARESGNLLLLRSGFRLHFAP